MNHQIHKIKPQSHSISWSFSRSYCNGKEKDYESGFHYYGARYYWSELLTGWISVDRYADKYPSISPYVYCAWSPVGLLDFCGDSITMTAEAWNVQRQAFLSVFDKKNENIPFAYDEASQKMSYTGKNENYQYSDTQDEIIEHYKSLCDNPIYNVNVQVAGNEQPILTSDGNISLAEQHAKGLTIDHRNGTADVYISNRPIFYQYDGKMMYSPQREDHQSIAILHEIGGHAYYYSQGIYGSKNNRLTTAFENRCRDIFKGKYGSREIRNGRALDEH